MSDRVVLDGELSLSNVLDGQGGSYNRYDWRGYSAYEVAVQEGFVGTKAEWLASLHGADGATGPQGEQGIQGPKGDTGDDYVLTEQDEQDIANLNMPDILKAFPTDTATGTVVSFTDGADGLPLKSLIVDIDPVQDLSQGDPSPTNICPISGWTGVQLSTNGIVIPISWQTEAGTVYGGKLDVLSGVLTVDVEYGQATAEYLSSRASGYIGYSASVTALGGNPAVWVRNLFSRAKDRVSGGIKAYCNAFPIQMNNTNISSSQNRCAFVVDGTTINSVETFISAVSTLEQNGGGLYVAYELKTPVEIQLTPHEVNSLLGTNNIFADTGDTALEYRADPDLYIQRKIPEVPVEDVQINGTSILADGVASIPIASANDLGTVKVNRSLGVNISLGFLVLSDVSSSQIKDGGNGYFAITPKRQHESTFYGLAKAAGDSTQSQSSNAVGTYTDEAKAAIRAMLGLDTASLVAEIREALGI